MSLKYGRETERDSREREEIKSFMCYEAAIKLSSLPLGGRIQFFSKLTARQSTITSLKHGRHFKKTQMFNYCASDHTFILGCRPKERRKKKARDLQLKSYKVANFTLEQNHLQWQISKAICMRFSWKADDPKFLCLTGSDLPHRTSRFFSAVSPCLLCCYKFHFPFLYYNRDSRNAV